jgi:hypothetical protein
MIINPNGVASFSGSYATTQPLQGCVLLRLDTQGSSRTRNPGLEDGIPVGVASGPIRWKVFPTPLIVPIAKSRIY